MLENRADLYVNECQKIRHYRARTTEERRKRRMPHCESRRMPNRDFFYFVRCVRKVVLYSDVIHSFDCKSAIEYEGCV